jgi:hypothetical protein
VTRIRDAPQDGDGEGDQGDRRESSPWARAVHADLFRWVSWAGGRPPDITAGSHELPGMCAFQFRRGDVILTQLNQFVIAPYIGDGSPVDQAM